MSSVVISGDTSGAITLSAPAVAGTNTITLPASTGTVLTTGSPQSGGVIQVVQGTTVSDTIVASTTFTDTTLTANITPKFATSKILVLVSQAYNVSRDNADNGMAVQILRNGTVVFSGDNTYVGAYFYTSTTVSFLVAGREFVQYLDSPASTSVLTYKTQGKTDNATSNGKVRFQPSSTTSVITLMEIAA